MAKSTNEVKVHVVILPYPVQGHLNPMVQFAKRLVSKNVKVTVATTTYTISSISTPSVSVESISDGFDSLPWGCPGFSADAFSESFQLHSGEFSLPADRLFFNGFEGLEHKTVKPKNQRQ